MKYGKFSFIIWTFPVFTPSLSNVYLYASTFYPFSDPFYSITSEYILRMNGHKSNWAFDFKPFITKCEIIVIRLPIQGIR